MAGAWKAHRASGGQGFSYRGADISGRGRSDPGKDRRASACRRALRRPSDSCALSTCPTAGAASASLRAFAAHLAMQRAATRPRRNVCSSSSLARTGLPLAKPRGKIQDAERDRLESSWLPLPAWFRRLDIRAPATPIRSILPLRPSPDPRELPRKGAGSFIVNAPLATPMRRSRGCAAAVISQPTSASIRACMSQQAGSKRSGKNGRTIDAAGAIARLATYGPRMARSITRLKSIIAVR